MRDPPSLDASDGVAEEEDEGIVWQFVGLGLVLNLADGDDDDAGSGTEHPYGETSADRGEG